jgi:hypothetical protein
VVKADARLALQSFRKSLLGRSCFQRPVSLSELAARQEC